MKNLMYSLAESVIPVLRRFLKPLFVEMINTYLLDVLKETDEETHKLVLMSGYPVIDTKLENLAMKTKTEFDDFGVEVIKESMEVSAANSGITLPNLDEGQPDD